MVRFLLVCLGGAVGSGVRYLVAGWALRLLGPSFPYGTLAVNVLGSFALAAVMHVGLTTDVMSPAARLALTTGVMGGFTTYSTFSYETLRYFQEGNWTLGVVNVVVTVIGCLVACLLGFVAARALVGP